jgi:hypothetical protein
MRLEIQLTHKFMYYTNIIYDDDGWKYWRRMKMKTSENNEIKVLLKLRARWNFFLFSCFSLRSVLLYRLRPPLRGCVLSPTWCVGWKQCSFAFSAPQIL